MISNFKADSDSPDGSSGSEEYKRALKEAADMAFEKGEECTKMINMYEVGIIGGKLFSNFFNTAVKPID